MGIRGLTTYIAQHSDRLLEPYELHNCTLVIDGNSIASVLYNWHSKCVSAFGGDYDVYANCVSNFFKELLKSHVSPIVLFDGGYETRKLNTVMGRLKGKIRLARDVTPTSSFHFFPLLMKEVFKDVLRTLNIAFAQCFFEADDEIAAIARRLQCPVLSYDSDYYVYDVLYIPFSTVNVQALKKVDNSAKHPQYFISCKIYTVDNFLDKFGGLNKSLLPLMATLLGNDYINRGIFKNFFSNLKCNKKCKKHKSSHAKIASLLKWLSNQTPESALEIVLLSLKKEYRSKVRQTILINTEGYVQCSSKLLPYLCLPSQGNIDVLHMPRDDSETVRMPPDVGGDSDNGDDADPGNSKNAQSDGDEVSSEFDSSNEESEDEDSNNHDIDISESEKATRIDCLPEWFKDSYCRGYLPSFFIDMLTRQTYFCSPQVEDYALPFSHTISMPIISTIYGLLNESQIKPLTCYSRNVYLCPEKQNLEATYGNALFCLYPPLAELASLTAGEQESFLIETLGISTKENRIVKELPSEWRLFVITIIFWIRHCKHPRLTNCHVNSLLMSIVALNVIDGKIGCLRSKRAINEALGRQHREPCEKKSEVNLASTSLKSINDFLQAVTRNDCVRVAEVLLSFHSVNQRLRDQVNSYSVTTVHAFAQFQSVLFHVMHLNALLNFPFPQCKPARFFSGIFIYNVYMNLKRRVDVMSYTQLLLSHGPSVGALYKVLAHSTVELFPDLHVLQRKKKRHLTFKPHIKGKPQEDNVSEHQSLSEEDDFVDLHNKFSALGACDD